MKTIIFRTMGAGNIGYGHYYRCMSLAKALLYKNSSLVIKFIVNSDLKDLLDISGLGYIISNDFREDIPILKQLNPDIIIFDSYLASNDYLMELSSISKLMIFDDNNDIYDASIPDIVLNGNVHAKDLDYKKRADGVYLFGTDYIVMKEEYWAKTNATALSDCKAAKEGILITTGGTDNYGISIQVLKALININCKKTVIIGPGYSTDYIRTLEEIANNDKRIELIYRPQSLKSHINSALIAITACGSTIYEVLSQNTMSIVFSLADNQDLICQNLSKKGIAYIGKYPKIDYDLLLSQVIGLMNLNHDKVDYENIKNVDEHIVIDSKGGLRVSDIIIEYIFSK